MACSRTHGDSRNEPWPDFLTRRRRPPPPRHLQCRALRATLAGPEFEVDEKPSGAFEVAACAGRNLIPLELWQVERRLMPNRSTCHLRMDSQAGRAHARRAPPHVSRARASRLDEGRRTCLSRRTLSEMDLTSEARSMRRRYFATAFASVENALSPTELMATTL